MLAGGVTRAFTHGLTGNVTLDDRGGSATTLTYNSLDRLVQVSAGVIPLVDYVYGAGGQRAVKATPTATTHYLYDPGGALYAETDGAGAVLREYVTLGGVTLAVIDSLGVSYVHNDHLSTGRKMTGDGGAVVWDASYRPFGEATITAAAATLNQRFPGQYADAETGYSDNWNRTYDPSLGRYLQSDPIGLAGGLNTYAYAGGNPVMRFDRRGLDMWDDARFYGGIALATVAVIALAPELAMVAATGWAVGHVAGALGIMGVQYAVGGWCNVDKDLLWMVAEEAAWTVGTAGAGALLKVGYRVVKSRGAADSFIDPASNLTREGVKRTNPSDWRKLRDLWDDAGYDDILSKANRDRIAKGKTPVVDDAWVKNFPGDAALTGEKIPMHHIGGNGVTVPLPETRHIDAHMPGGFRYNSGGPGISG